MPDKGAARNSAAWSRRWRRPPGMPRTSRAADDTPRPREVRLSPRGHAATLAPRIPERRPQEDGPGRKQDQHAHGMVVEGAAVALHRLQETVQVVRPPEVADEHGPGCHRHRHVPWQRHERSRQPAGQQPPVGQPSPLTVPQEKESDDRAGQQDAHGPLGEHGEAGRGAGRDEPGPTSIRRAAPEKVEGEHRAQQQDGVGCGGVGEQAELDRAGQHQSGQ